MKAKNIVQTIIGLSICYLGVIYIPQGVKRFFKIDGEVPKFLLYAFFQISLCLSLLYYVVKVEGVLWTDSKQIIVK